MHVALGVAKCEADEKALKNWHHRAMASRAIEEGRAALVIEARNFGESSLNGYGTSCTEAAKIAILQGRTVIGERVWDAMRILDAVEKNFSEIDMSDIVCTGNSGGGTATAYTAIFEDRIKLAMPSCAVCDWEDSVAIMSHCACNHVPYIAKYFDMGDLVAMTAPKCEIVVSGAEDNGFLIDGAKNSVAVGRRVYEALGVSDNLVHVIANAGHRFYADDSYPHVHKLLGEL